MIINFNSKESSYKSAHFIRISQSCYFSDSAGISLEEDEDYFELEFDDLRTFL
jgi:hypothetical protein